MPFRDQAPVCPRCRVGLMRAADEREAWHCPRCAGTALGIGDVIDDLPEVAPHLRPAADLACPACGQSMEPVYLAAVEIERCRQDSVVWLERGEREAIVARAAAQPRPGGAEHLRAVLFGPSSDESKPSRSSRIATALSAATIVIAAPLALFGLVLIWMGESSENGGSAGALAGLLTIGGAFALVIATILFVVGAIVFVRAAR
jgi:Zn-finger nucleic acid-binding protein